MCYIGVTEGKIEKEAKMSFSIFVFIYTIHLAYLKVYAKFENTGSNRSREICDRNFHWRGIITDFYKLQKHHLELTDK